MEFHNRAKLRFASSNPSTPTPRLARETGAIDNRVGDPSREHGWISSSVRYPLSKLEGRPISSNTLGALFPGGPDRRGKPVGLAIIAMGVGVFGERGAPAYRFGRPCPSLWCAGVRRFKSGRKGDKTRWSGGPTTARGARVLPNPRGMVPCRRQRGPCWRQSVVCEIEPGLFRIELVLSRIELIRCRRELIRSRIELVLCPRQSVRCQIEPVLSRRQLVLSVFAKVRAVRTGASVSLSSVPNGGEGWGEEALPKVRRLPTERHPSPRPSPRSRLTGRGRRTRSSSRRLRHILSQRVINPRSPVCLFYVC